MEDVRSLSDDLLVSRFTDAVRDDRRRLAELLSLIGEIDAALDDYRRIVVPWGALHLPEVQEAVRARGFELRSTDQKLLLRYATVFWALLGSGRQD